MVAIETLDKAEASLWKAVEDWTSMSTEQKAFTVRALELITSAHRRMGKYSDIVGVTNVG